MNHLRYELSARRGSFKLTGSGEVEFRRLGIFGPSGSGKSTFMELLAGLDIPREGKIIFNGQTWFDSGQKINVATRNRKVAVQFQSAALFPHMTVKANLEFSGQENLISAHGQQIIDQLGLSNLLQRYPDQISGGERRRVALAQALYRRPALLCLDEPFSGLDDCFRQRLLPDLAKLLHDEALPAVVVSHRPEDILALCESVIPVRGGKMGEIAGVSSFFQHRPAEYSDMLGQVNYFKGTCRGSTDGELMVFETEGGLKLRTTHNSSRLAAGDRVLITIPADSILLA